jgi:protein-S-isoprenylcysteine O-methyltransferase Ste14
MKKLGKPQGDRSGNALYSFEKTSELVQSGIFKYIRHPMYGSLLFLTWGVCLKNPEIILIFISVLSSIFLYITAKTEEKEDVKFFGEEYKKYIKKTKMFIPYIL